MKRGRCLVGLFFFPDTVSFTVDVYKNGGGVGLLSGGECIVLRSSAASAFFPFFFA